MRAPRMTDEFVYGVASGNSVERALDFARAEAAKSIEVNIREEMTDTQTLWVDRSAGTTRESSRDNVSRAVTSFVERRLNSCDTQARCVDAAGETHVLVACARRSELERRLALAATQMAETPLANAALLAVPGIDERGYITQLGEYMARVLRDGVARGHAVASGSMHIVTTAPWKPAALHDAAREGHASHLLRVEHLLLEDRRVRVSAYLQDVKTDHHVPGSDVSFDAELEPAQLALLSVQGPLLPQKDAHDLVNTRGDYAVPMRLSKTDLKEGEEVSISISLPIEGYVYLYDFYEDGQAVLLLPSALHPDNHFVAGSKLSLPDAEWKRAGATLVACPLDGHAVTRESVKVVVSPVPLDLPGAKFSATGFTSLSMTDPEATLGSVRNRIEELKAKSVPIGTADMQYFIRAAKRRVKACGG